MQATITAQPTIPAPTNTPAGTNGTEAAVEKAEKLILRWYRVSEFHPTEEWDIFGVACDALVHIEDHGIVAFIESDLPATDPITKAIWPVMRMFARRAMLLTRTPWTGGAYYWDNRCKCTSTDPIECTGPCKCMCDDCR